MLELKPLALLAQIVNFAVLMWVLHIFLFRPIREALKQRQESIEGSFREIADQKDALERMKTDYEERLQQIEETMQEMRRTTLRDTQREREEILAEARAESERIVEKSRVRLEQDSLRVLDTLRDHIVDLTMRSVKTVLQENLDEEKQLAVIERVLAEAETLPWQKN